MSVCFGHVLVFVLQLKGSDLELTIVKGSSAPRAPLNGPACSYVNIRVKVNNKEQGKAKNTISFSSQKCF